MSVLDRFEVMEVPRTFSIAEVRLLKNRLSFNLSAASEIGYPAYVRVFISHDRTQIALQPCEKTTPNACVFFTAETAARKRRRAISVGNRALTTLIKSWMGWDLNQPMIVPGIRFAEENVIIFDLLQAHAKDSRGSDASLCVVPVPAAPFYQIPKNFRVPENPSVICAEGRVIV